MELTDSAFLTADDVAAYLGIAKPTAYKLIQRLNAELKQKGLIIIAGKVDRDYFLSRVKYSG